MSVNCKYWASVGPYRIRKCMDDPCPLRNIAISSSVRAATSRSLSSAAFVEAFHSTHFPLFISENRLFRRWNINLGHHTSHYFWCYGYSRLHTRTQRAYTIAGRPLLYVSKDRRWVTAGATTVSQDLGQPSSSRWHGSFPEVTALPASAPRIATVAPGA